MLIKKIHFFVSIDCAYSYLRVHDVFVHRINLSFGPIDSKLIVIVFIIWVYLCSF